MSVRVLSTSPLVGPALRELGRALPELRIAPFRSTEWQEALAEAEALVVLLSEPLTEADLAKAPRLKAIGSEAREELEKLFPPRVYLELFVKVQPHWRNNSAVVAELDYRNDGGSER